MWDGVFRELLIERCLVEAGGVLQTTGTRNFVRCFGCPGKHACKCNENKKLNRVGFEMVPRLEGD